MGTVVKGIRIIGILTLVCTALACSSPEPEPSGPSLAELEKIAVDYCNAEPTALGSASTPEELVLAANVDRNQLGIPPLIWSDALAETSLEWSQEMLRRDILTPEPGDALANNPALPDDVKENVTMVLSNNAITEDIAIRRAHSAWFSSPSHCSIVLDPHLTRMGASTVSSDDGTVWYTTAYYG